MENAIMAGKLKPLDVERETRPGKYLDGDGLYLVVASDTSKNWNYMYWKDGKQRWLGLGSLKDVSLKDARLARDAARLRVKGDRSTPGVDIVQEKRAAREKAKVVESKVTLPTFEECTEAYPNLHSHPRQNARWLPGRIDLSESRWRSVFRECDARRTGSSRLQPRNRAWILLDLRNLGG
jgi:hypothetical protein